MNMIMKEVPILFSTPMVQAILDGGKTMTRRIVKPQPPEDSRFIMFTEYRNKASALFIDGNCNHIKCVQPCKPGDILWVRETWRHNGYDYKYKADMSIADYDFDKWRPSIHMPREAARIFLKVKNVRIERLRDISEADAKAEGVSVSPDVCGNPKHTHIEAFQHLWDDINAKRGYSWDRNPWVWVIEFERIER